MFYINTKTGCFLINKIINYSLSAMSLHKHQWNTTSAENTLDPITLKADYQIYNPTRVNVRKKTISKRGNSITEK